MQFYFHFITHTLQGDRKFVQSTFGYTKVSVAFGLEQNLKSTVSLAIVL